MQGEARMVQDKTTQDGDKNPILQPRPAPARPIAIPSYILHNMDPILDYHVLEVVNMRSPSMFFLLKIFK